MNECTFEGCTREVHIKKDGLCRRHYFQKWSGKDLTPVRTYTQRKQAPAGYLHCTGCDTFKKEDDFYARANGKPQQRCKRCTIKANREATLARRARQAAGGPQ